MNRSKFSGFTLIELMVVVAIVAILAAIAYPAYQAQVRKGKRSEATATLLETSQQLERCYTRFNTYADLTNCAVAITLGTTAGVVSTEGNYSIRATGANLAANSYTLTALPRAGTSQTHDDQCASFTLTNTNVKGATDSGSGNSTGHCW